MELSLNLLNKYVDISDQDSADLADKITKVGLEVEGMHQLARGTDLTVGYVQECKEHPDSDHLNVCQVEIKPGEVTQIVCGAPNVAAGQKVIVANVGCDLGEGFVIKAAKVRGEESNGMICSLAELGIDQRFLTEEQKAGIEVLAKDAPIGVPALPYLQLEDTVLEIGLTPNRADCMAITSMAYEVGAILNRDLKLPEIKKYEELDSDIEVSIESELCPFFGAKLVKGLVTKPSPQWLKSVLMASGIKPINNIVDISNFVMLESGQPIHMYDYDKLQAKKFTVKTGMELESKMLDGLDYEIKATDLIVSTDDRVGCIAGVMGSEDTKVDETTTNIVIEAATFDGPTLRDTARRLNLLTDASQHFIKSALDTANSLNVLDRCADLLMELAEGKEVYKTVASTLDVKQTVVSINTSDVNGLLGTEVQTSEINDIFSSLKFEFTNEGDEFVVTVPTYRKDITMKADLIEEVARVYGYDAIPSTLPEMSMTIGRRNKQQEYKEMIRDLLVNQGLHETVTYTLTSPSSVEDFNLFHNESTVELAWPLGEERSVTRKSVIPSLLQVTSYNNSHNQKDVNLFEVSSTYDNDKELQTLSIACSGLYNELAFNQTRYVADFYLVKGFVEEILKKLGINESRYRFKRVEQDNKDYHPGQAAYLEINKKIVGVVGKVHPLMAKKYKVKNVFVAQLNLTELLNLKTGNTKFKEIPTYPIVTRDIALVMDKEIETYDVVRKIVQASKQLIIDTKIFDIYLGENIGEDKKSVAIKLLFQDSKGTLDEFVINDVMKDILTAVEKDFNAVLRLRI